PADVRDNDERKGIELLGASDLYNSLRQTSTRRQIVGVPDMREGEVRIELDRTTKFAFGNRPLPVVMTDVAEGGVRFRERVVRLDGGDRFRLRTWTHVLRRGGPHHDGPELVVTIGKSSMSRPVC